MRIHGSFMAFLWTVVLSNGVCAASKINEVKLENLAKRSEVQSASLSPDGKTLVVLAPQGDYGAKVLFFDIETMKVESGITDSMDTLPGAVEWASEDRVVISVARKFGGFASPAFTGELISVNRNGKSARVLAGGNLVDGWVDDPKYLLTSGGKYSSEGVFTELFRESETSSVAKRMARAPLRSCEFLVDYDQHPRLAFGEDVDGNWMLYSLMESVLNTSKSNSNWKLVQNQREDGESLKPIMFAPNNDSFYAFWSPRTGPAHLVLVDAKTFVHKDLYVPQFASPLKIFKTADQKDIYAVATQDGASDVKILFEEKPEARAFRALAKSFPGVQLEPVNFSRDGSVALFRVWASNDSGAYYFYNVKEKAAKLLFALDSWLVPELMAKSQPITFQSRDGMNLHGFLTLPSNGARHNLPLVILPHGGPYEVRDDDRYDPWVQVFATRGYAVLKINFRGSGGYGRDFLEAGYGEWGRVMQDDLTDGTRWAIEQGYADAKRVAIFGASYGGYAALMGAAREPKLYRAAISYAGVSDLTLMQSYGDIEDSAYGQHYLKRVLGGDKGNLQSRSPVYLVAQIQVPILLIHGGQDQRVPIKHAQRMREALEEANKTVEFFSVNDEMHGFYKEKNILESYQRILAFLDKYLTVPNPK